MSRDHVSTRKARESFTLCLLFLNLIFKSVMSAVWNYGIGPLGIFLTGIYSNTPPQAHNYILLHYARIDITITTVFPRHQIQRRNSSSRLYLFALSRQCSPAHPKSEVRCPKSDRIVYPTESPRCLFGVVAEGMTKTKTLFFNFNGS